MYDEGLYGEEEIVLTVSLGRRIVVSIFGLFMIGLISLLAVEGWYNGKIVAGVSVGHTEIGGLTLDQARQKLNAAEAKLSPSFVVAGKRYHPTLDELGAHYDTEAVLKQAYTAGRDGIAAHPQQLDLALTPIVDSNRLASYLAPITHIGTAPVDARLEVAKGLIRIVPDIAGFTIDKPALQKALLSALTTFTSDETVIAPEILPAAIRAPDLSEAQAQAQALMGTKIGLTDETTLITLSSADIANLISFVVDENSKTVAKVDATKVGLYVETLAKRLDHLPIDRKVTIADGVKSVQNEGKDGDVIDREPIVVALTKLTAGQSISLIIARHAAPFKTITTNIVGISSGRYIEINLIKQHLWVWDNHAVIYESPLTSGAVGAGLGTVTGTFSIYLKKTNTHLVGRDYSVPVKYWMPFYLGYGLHDAVWRHGRFGGQDYIYAGSHGCVNLPDATAEWLYNWADIGTPVFIHK